MSTISIKTKKHSILICHIIAGVFAGVFFFSSFEFDSFNIWNLLEGLLAIGVFYTHALVLIPLLLMTKAINKYAFLTFGLFAISAVISAIFRIASQSDYVYIFTKIMFHGPAFGSSIENLYEENFFIFPMLFVGSFVYGLFVTKTKDSLNYLGKLIFGKKYAELLIHGILLLVISITSYFADFFLSNVMVGCFVLYFFKLLIFLFSLPHF